MRRVLLLVALVTAAPHAHAHVAPSVDDNNRYLKLTPQGDRVRLAYTVFFGEVPGAVARKTIDANHDGQISDDESRSFGDRIAADVIGALDVNVDGVQQRLEWKTVSVGMGLPVVNAGSFSIDMIVYLCTSPRGRHRVLVRDEYRVPKPGETEVFVEDGLGIKVEHARIGQATAIGNDFKFVGPGGPLSDDGLDLAYVASDQAPLSNDCVALAPVDDDRPPWLWLGLAIGAGLAVLLAIAYAFLFRRRK